MDDRFVQAIIDGDLKVGASYSLDQVADVLQTSRDVLLQTVGRLVRYRVIDLRPGREVRIARITARDIGEIFEIWRLVQPTAAAKAASGMGAEQRKRLASAFAAMLEAAKVDDRAAFWRHDRTFHRVILEGSGNRLLADHVDGHRYLVLLLGNTKVLAGRSLTRIAEEHGPIVDALLARDPVRASAAMEEHLASSGPLIVGATASSRSASD